jgi:hypothetical protein
MNRSRIGLATISLVLTAGVGLTACSQSAPAPTPGPSADPVRSRTHDAPALAAPIDAEPAAEAPRRDAGATASSLTDGRHPARITAIDAEDKQVTIDVVEFFLGEAATEAAQADHAPDVPPPNDHWIRNVNPKLRSLSVAAAAPVVVNTLSANETGSATSNSTISLSKLASYGDVRVSYSLFWVTTRDGTVTGIAEQFLP